MNINNTKPEKEYIPSVGSSVCIDKAIRSSGLLAYLSPEDFQTLVALLTFADEKSGICFMSAGILGQTLNLTESGARKRLSRLCSIQWRGRPLVVKENRRENGKFLAAAYEVAALEGLRMSPDASRDGLRDDGKDDHGVPENVSSSGDDTPGPQLLGPGETAFLKPALPSRNPEGTPGMVLSGDTRARGDSCVNNINKHNTGTQDGALDVKERIRSALIKVGVSGSIANELLVSCPADKLIRQIRLLPFRNAKEPAAMLVKAIREDWSAPSAYMLREKEETGQKEKAEAEAREAQERKLWQEKIDAAKAKLSQQEHEDIRKAARDQVIKQVGHIFPVDVPETLVKSAVNRIISKKYLNHEKD